MKNTLAFALCGLVALVTSCGSSKKDAHSSSESTSEKTISVTSEAQFNDVVIKSAKPTVVAFSAPWCGACKIMKPIFRTIAAEKTSVQFVEIDVDDLGALAQKYKISGIPTFVFFKDGNELPQESRIVGSTSAADFSAHIDKKLS